MPEQPNVMRRASSGTQDLATVAQRVTQVLEEQDLEMAYTDAGTISVRYGRARAEIHFREYGGALLVQLIFPLLVTRPSDALFEFVATHSADYVMGAISVSRDADDLVSVWFTHLVVAEAGDEDPVVYALFHMSRAAEQLYEILQKRFGGRVPR